MGFDSRTLLFNNFPYQTKKENYKCWEPFLQLTPRVMNHYEYCEFVCSLPYHVFRTQLFIEGVVVGKAYIQSNTTFLSIS